MYFRLNPECYFVKGKRCGSIYDLIEGNIYSLNQEETKIAESCEKNDPVVENDFLKKLKELCVGNFYDKQVYIQKLRLGTPKEEMQPPAFYRAFLEISNLCNRNCWFCGYYGIKRNLGCLGCNKWNENGEALKVKRWKSLLDELKDLNCTNIFLTGGDLTLAWDKTLEILDFANKKFNKVYITLHEKSFYEDIRKDLANKAQPIIQTENPSLQSENLILLLSIRPEEFENLKIEKNVTIDFVSEDFNSLPSNLSITSKRKIPKVNAYRFFHNIEYHPCLGNTLTISYAGKVLPCPMMRNYSLGSIKNKELYKIFERGKEEINKFWNLTLDHIEKCKKCEFRYACSDCRALEEKLTGKLDGKRLCNYDPKEGKWL